MNWMRQFLAGISGRRGALVGLVLTCWTLQGVGFWVAKPSQPARETVTSLDSLRRRSRALCMQSTVAVLRAHARQATPKDGSELSGSTYVCHTATGNFDFDEHEAGAETTDAEVRIYGVTW